MYTSYWVVAENLFLTMCCFQKDTKNVDSDGHFGRCIAKIRFLRSTDEM